MPPCSSENFDRAATAIQVCAGRHNLEIVEFEISDHDVRTLQRTPDAVVIKVPLRDPFSVIVDMVAGVAAAEQKPLGTRLSDELHDVGYRAMGIIACRRGR